MIIFQLVVGAVIMLAALLTALDAHDRGIRKESVILWFFAIAIFPPVILIYVVLRNIAARKRFVNVFPPTPLAPQEQPEETSTCPYCGSNIHPLDRICPSCGRLL